MGSHPLDSPSFSGTPWPEACSQPYGEPHSGCVLVLPMGCTVLAVQGGWKADTSVVSQVIFITEYVSSGSLKQFLKKTKKNHKAMNARVGFLRAHRKRPR